MGKMKAAVVVKHGQSLEIQEREIPEPKQGQILVKLEVCGVCHTDVHVAKGDFGAGAPLPMIPGHEGCGIVAKLGPGVENVKVGDRVGVPWLHSACGRCFDCRDGWETVCTSQTQTGFSAFGCFAEYTIAEADYVGRIPDNLSFELAAPILCAGATSYKALKVSDVKPGQFVVITGAAGGLGHVCCQYAVAMGMRVIAVSRKLSPEKESMLKGFGVEFMVDMSKMKLADEVKKISRSGAHGVICLAPCADDIKNAVEYICPRGVIVPVALPPGNLEASILSVVLKGAVIRGSIVGTRNDLEEALQFAANGKVKCIVKKCKFDEINSIMEQLCAGTIPGRVVMQIA